MVYCKPINLEINHAVSYVNNEKSADKFAITSYSFQCDDAMKIFKAPIDNKDHHQYCMSSGQENNEMW